MIKNPKWQAYIRMTPTGPEFYLGIYWVLLGIVLAVLVFLKELP